MGIPRWHSSAYAGPVHLYSSSAGATDLLPGSHAAVMVGGSTPLTCTGGRGLAQCCVTKNGAGSRRVPGLCKQTQVWRVCAGLAGAGRPEAVPALPAYAASTTWVLL